MAYINKKKIFFAGISKGISERYTEGVIIEDIETEEDALAGTWVMDMFPTDINVYNWQNWEQSVDFVNGNGTIFTGIKQIYSAGDITTYYNSSGTWLRVADDGFFDDYNRYLTFTSSAQDVSVTFLSWLQANATKQVDTNEDGGSAE